MLMPRPYAASADGDTFGPHAKRDILAWQCAMRPLWWHLTITLVRTRSYEVDAVRFERIQCGESSSVLLHEYEDVRSVAL